MGINPNVVLTASQSWVNNHASNGPFLNVSGVVTGSGNLTKDGTGILNLTNSANTYTGKTIIKRGFVRFTGNDGSFGENPAVFTPDQITLDNSAGFTSDQAGLRFFTQTAPVTFGASNRGITILGNTIFDVSHTENTATLANVITGSGNLAKNNVGTLILTAANTYGGATTINNGKLELSGGNNRSPITTKLTIGNLSLSNSGVLQLDGVNQELAGLTSGVTGASNLVVGGSVTLSTLTVNLATGSQTFSGTLGGAGTNQNNLAFAKSGNGTLILTGANTYSGTTTVDAGTLLVNGSLTGAGGAINVNSGGTLGGSGTISRAVNINAAGTLAPGNSPDQIFTGALTLAPLSIYEVEILGTSVGDGITGYDQTVVTGGVSLNGAILTVLPVAGLSIGDTFTIIDNDGVDLVSGTFAGLSEGASFRAGWYGFSISYVGNSGNDVVLTLNYIVPEPSTFSLLGMTVIGLGFFARKRRK